jgi:hypothetical protein
MLKLLVCKQNVRAFDRKPGLQKYFEVSRENVGLLDETVVNGVYKLRIW